MTRYAHIWMALVYLLAASLPAYLTIGHTDNEIKYLKQAYDTNNLQNNGAIKEAAVWKEIVTKHHFLGPIIERFFAPALNKEFHFPQQKDAQQALDKIPDLNQLEKSESTASLLWTLVMFVISLIYFLVTFIFGNKARADHLFSLTIISVISLVVGIIAPAMVIVISPVTEIFPHFILRYEVRSIFGVISQLYLSSYWIVAVCLTVFSMLIPLAKAGLAIFVLESADLSRKKKIAKLLHDISKWSMADVFVAAILLSNFAVKANKSTQADLFLGFYYFLGYCLLSMVTTTLLQNKFLSAPEKGRIKKPHSIKIQKH